MQSLDRIRLGRLLQRRDRRRLLQAALVSGGPVAGVLLTVLYFLRIGYVPLDSLGEMTALGAVVAAISLLLMVSLALMLAVPGVLVGAAAGSRHRDDWCHWLSPSTSRREDPAGLRGRALAFSACTLGFAWLLFFLPVLSQRYLAWELRAWLYTTVATFGLAFLIEYALSQRPVVSDHGPRPRPSAWWLIARPAGALLYGTVGLFPLFVFLTLITHSQVGATEEPATVWVVFGLGTAVVVLAHAAALDIAVSTKRTGVVAASQGAAVLLTLALGIHGLGAWGSLHNLIMAASTVRLERVHLVLKQEACASLAHVGVPTAAVESASDNRGCALFDVTVQSRLGDRWAIECRPAEPGETQRPPAFTVAADDVVQWYRLDRTTPRVHRRRLCELQGWSASELEAATSVARPK